MRRREVASASVVRAVCVVVIVVSASVSAFAFVFLPRDAFAPTAVHLAGAAALAKALTRRATGFYVPLEPPSLQEGGGRPRAANGGGLGDSRRARCPRLPQPLSHLCRLRPPLSSSLLFFCRWGATQRCAAWRGKKAAPRPWPWRVLSSARACLCRSGRGGGTRSSLRSQRGGGRFSPPPLAADRRIPRRWQQRQHGWKGEP